MKTLDRQETGIWDFTVISAAFFAAGLIPLHLIAPLHSEFDFHTILLVLKVIFLIDVIRHFFFSNQGDIKSQSKSIVNYFNFWVFFDLLAIAPYGLLSGYDDYELITILKIISVSRLAVINVRKRPGSKLFFAALWIALFVHYAACLWLLLLGISFGTDNITNYIDSVYKIISVMSSVGFGNTIPITNFEKIFFIAIKITGFATLIYLISITVSIVFRRDQNSKKNKSR